MKGDVLQKHSSDLISRGRQQQTQIRLCLTGRPGETQAESTTGLMLITHFNNYIVCALGLHIVRLKCLFYYEPHISVLILTIPGRQWE